MAKMQLSFLVAVYIIFAQNGITEGAKQCLSMSNHPIDWFIVYKLPSSNDFYYMDATKQTWVKPATSMNQRNHAVYFTLQQIYGGLVPGKDMYAFYNNEPANGQPHRSFGHVKGVVSFDDVTGFWMIHSTPRFPNVRSAGYSWPASASINGQSFLCVSMATASSINDVGKQLQRLLPFIYDKEMPASLSHYTEMVHAVNGDPFVVTLRSLRGSTFYSIAKPAIADADIYRTLSILARDDVLAETWRRNQNLPSYCGHPKVENVEEIRFPTSKFSYTKDHSKWAVTKNKHLICIGDLNREGGQLMSAGGTVCMENIFVATSFRNLIVGYEKCPSQGNTSSLEFLSHFQETQNFLE